jgi:hypothetical protein
MVYKYSKKGCDYMSTYYIKEDGKMIGKVIVTQGGECKVVNVHTVRRVKPVVYFVAGVLFTLLIMCAVKLGSQRYEDMYRACDEAKGYTCSYYEARQFMLRGE